MAEKMMKNDVQELIVFSPLQILKTTFKKNVIANNINILHEFRFMFYMFLLLLQR